MDTITAITTRRSIRKYKNTPVEKDIVTKILEAGNWAPSAGNHQPWRFSVVQNAPAAAICKLFDDFCQSYIPNASYIPEEKKAGMLAYAKNFGGAPQHIAVSYIATGDAIVDEEALMAACAAAQNILLAAHELGIGTVWIAGPLLHNPKTREALSLPDNQKLAAIIPFGYPDMEPPAPPRQDAQLEYVRWLG